MAGVDKAQRRENSGGRVPGRDNAKMRHDATIGREKQIHQWFKEQWVVMKSGLKANPSFKK